MPMDCQAWLFLWCYMELSTSRCFLLSSPNCFEFPAVLKSPPQIMIVRKISVINLNNSSCNHLSTLDLLYRCWDSWNKWRWMGMSPYSCQLLLTEGAFHLTKHPEINEWEQMVHNVYGKSVPIIWKLLNFCYPKPSTKNSRNSASKIECYLDFLKKFFSILCKVILCFGNFGKSTTLNFGRKLANASTEKSFSIYHWKFQQFKPEFLVKWKVPSVFKSFMI